MGINTVNKRPRLQLFDLQANKSQKTQFQKSNLPKVNAFLRRQVMETGLNGTG
jgi:hypothetical protein